MNRNRERNRNKPPGKRGNERGCQGHAKLVESTLSRALERAADLIKRLRATA
jgi:hypothetical protein